ncbi:hypothetical protein Leryth_005697 [Lithospermum erythrorhizon]|nr:hypothetical protein Leryth_005697 [Lithospermum erythrorhizon]
MCCGSKVCMLCSCVIMMVIVLGMIFGFGVFKHGFNKLKNTVHDDGDDVFGGGRPFLGFTAPPPF